MKQICATCAYFFKLGKSITYCSCKEGNHYGSTYYTSSHTPKCEDYKCRYIAKGVPIKNGNPRGKDNNKKQPERKIGGDTMDCLLSDKCLCEGCDDCQYNADAYLQDNFKFNGAGEEPTNEEFDEALEYAE